MHQVSTEILCEGNTGNAEAQKTFTEATERRQVNDKNDFQAIEAEFILPFTKEIFQNKEEQQTLFTETVASIRKKLPAEDDRNNITILRTIIEKKDGKKLHAVRLIAPPKLQSSILELKLNGIDVRGKHIKAWGLREYPLKRFPREVTVHFRSLAHFFEDEDIYDCINFLNVKKLSPLMKEKFLTEDQGYVYTGFAYGKVMVSNENEEKALKNWAEQSCTKSFQLYEMDFYCNTPSLLTCAYCQTLGNNARGHHEAYCSLKRTENKQSYTNRKQIKDAIEMIVKKIHPYRHQVTKTIEITMEIAWRSHGAPNQQNLKKLLKVLRKRQ